MNFSCLDSLEPKVCFEILSVVSRLADLNSNGAVSVAEMQTLCFELQPGHKDLALKLFGELLVESADAELDRNKKQAIPDTSRAMIKDFYG